MRATGLRQWRSTERNPYWEYRHLVLDPQDRTLVRRIVEAHGDRVYVTEAPDGKGAALVIGLTVADHPA